MNCKIHANEPGPIAECAVQELTGKNSTMKIFLLSV